ncbi:YjiH family protein [Fusobacterium nucleatum]|uniref:YjiH family protein n=1 Tax=Fusobacterium nucleatum TaxID=851 RepID=UPI0030D22CC8
MFFISIKIGDRNTIPIDHLVKFILKIPHLQIIYGITIIFVGTIFPLIKKTWNKNKLNFIMSILNIIGLIFTIMSIFKFGPEIITQESMGPYVLFKVVIPVILIVPIGSIFLAFLVSYGLMEGIGTLMEPIMRPIFKTPGRSAIDAVASFVGSYSLALLVTNGVYRENKYTIKEAAIIATGFSTVSATFMIITLNTLNLMEYWNLYFWVCLIVTFIATAITARIYPLSKMPDIYFNKNLKVENKKSNIFREAWNTAISNFLKSDSVLDNTISNLKSGIKLALNIGATIMSVGVISLLLAQYTKIFDILGYLFYPLTLFFKTSDPFLIAKSATITIADMYVPAIISTGASIDVRFIIAVLCISEILFFSASIPCILATDIPIKVRDIIIIWFERVVISLILIVPIVKFIF